MEGGVEIGRSGWGYHLLVMMVVVLLVHHHTRHLSLFAVDGFVHTFALAGGREVHRLYATDQVSGKFLFGQNAKK